MAFLVGGANSASGGYEISNSCRFNDGDSAQLSKAFGANAASRKKFTISFWTKRGELGSDNAVFGAKTDSNTWSRLHFDSSDRIRLQNVASGSTNLEFEASPKLRDPSAWYHIVFALDTSQGAIGDGVKLYINGTRITDTSSSSYTQDAEFEFVKNGITTYIGHDSENSSYFDGHISEFFYVDNQQLAPTAFGETDEDTGIWIPIDAKGDLTFGTNGFYLEFQQTGTGTASTSTIGADTSGNTNHLTSTNLAALDITVDTPTNNFATLNPLNLRLGKGITFSEGNTQIQTGTTGGTVGGFSTIAGLKSGKWYAEFKPTVVGTNGTMRFGIESTDFMAAAGLCNIAASAYASNGNKGRNATDTSHGDSFDDDDIIGVAVDLDNGAIYFSKNGTWQNSSDPESGASKTNAAYTDILTVLPDGGYMFAFNLVYNNSQQENVQANFGNPCNAISSGNADGNGYGNFEYAVPSGYYALCTKNLAEYG